MVTLEYGGIATRHGVVCDMRDDGATITLPATLHSATSGSPHMLVALASMLIWLTRRYILKHQFPPSVIIELNRTELRIAQRTRSGTAVRSWPREQVGEVRANRYSRGLLVRIPGRDNFDMLGEYNDDVAKCVGEALTETMRKTNSE